MSHETPPQLAEARALAANLEAALGKAPSFERLDPATKTTLVRDLAAIQNALGSEHHHTPGADPYALTLGTPDDLLRRRRGEPEQPAANGGSPSPEPPSPSGPREAATQTLAARTGALIDEIDFPGFVAGLVHGTFDAIVDATIRQMEAFADLVSAVAKDVDEFTSQNVTPNQVRDWLVQRYPGDLQLDVSGGEPKVKSMVGEDGEPPSPSWLADFGLEGERLTDELIEERLVPAARKQVGENRLQTLATLVLLGMSRVNIRDGSISARVRFRAAAKDVAHVDYAVTQDPGGGSSWGARGSAAYVDHQMMVSTVGVNVQADTDIKAELFGEVQINFVSETLPLERFVDAAKMTLLQRNTRAVAPTATTATTAVPAPEPTAPVATTPVTVPASTPATPVASPGPVGAGPTPATGGNA
jgi:hypothetical protein